MNSNSKLSYAIAAILSSASTGIVHAADAPAADTNSDAISEIIVTAQRRSENIDRKSVV